MSILKKIMSFQIFITNKMLVIIKINGIKSDNKLIKKSTKLKTEKMSKLRKLKGQKLSKSKKLLKCENLSKNNTIKISSFLIFNLKMAFNYL